MTDKFDKGTRSNSQPGARDAAALAGRMRREGVACETVARVFARVALDNAARAQPYAHPELLRDWLFGLLSVDSIKTSQAQAAADFGPERRRASFRVVEGDGDGVIRAGSP